MGRSSVLARKETSLGYCTAWPITHLFPSRQTSAPSPLDFSSAECDFVLAVVHSASLTTCRCTQSTVHARAFCAPCSIASSSSEQLAITASAWPWHGSGEQWHPSGFPRSSRRAASTHRCPSVSSKSHCQYASTAVWCAAVVRAAGRETRLPHRPSPRRPTYTMLSGHGPPSSRLHTKCRHLDVMSARVHRRVSQMRSPSRTLQQRTRPVTRPGGPPIQHNAQRVACSLQAPQAPPLAAASWSCKLERLCHQEKNRGRTRSRV